MNGIYKGYNVGTEGKHFFILAFVCVCVRARAHVCVNFVIGPSYIIQKFQREKEHLPLIWLVELMSSY